MRWRCDEKRELYMWKDVQFVACAACFEAMRLQFLSCGSRAL